jgi:hypothetical protein
MPTIVEASDRFCPFVAKLFQLLAEISDARLVIVGIDRLDRHGPALVRLLLRSTERTWRGTEP